MLPIFTYIYIYIYLFIFIYTHALSGTRKRPRHVVDLCLSRFPGLHHRLLEIGKKIAFSAWRRGNNCVDPDDDHVHVIIIIIIIIIISSSSSLFIMLYYHYIYIYIYICTHARSGTRKRPRHRVFLNRKGKTNSFTVWLTRFLGLHRF